MVAQAPGKQIRDFWREQLKSFRDLASLTKPIARDWYSHTPEPIKPAVGLINAPLLAALISVMDIGDPAWASQFVHGFPITGFLSQSGVFPSDDTPLPEQLDPDTLFKSASGRFKKRAKQTSNVHQQHIWDETIKEQNKGWFGEARQLTASGTFLGNKKEPCNPTFRFLVYNRIKSG